MNRREFLKGLLATIAGTAVVPRMLQGNQLSFPMPDAPDDGFWHHVAITRDQDEVRTFLDGKEVTHFRATPNMARYGPGDLDAPVTIEFPQVEFINGARDHVTDLVVSGDLDGEFTAEAWVKLKGDPND